MTAVAARRFHPPSPAAVIRLSTLLLAMLLIVTASAAAHTRLLRTEPADNAAAAGPVHSVRLWFSTPVDITSDGVEITGPDGRRVDGRSARTTAEDPSVVEVPVDGRAGGRYSVRWTVISADGHPITGGFSFVVAADGVDPDSAVAAPVVTDEAQPVPERVPVGKSMAAAGRGLHYLALVLGLGPLLFGALVLRGAGSVPPLAHARAWAVAALGAVLLFPAAVLTLVAQSAAIAGSYSGAVGRDVLDSVLGSRWGAFWQIRLGLAALLVWLAVDAVFRSRRRDRAAAAAGAAALRGRHVAALLTGGLLVVLSALDGHAASTPPVALSVGVDALHLLAVCAWIGGLVALLAVLMPTLRPLGEVERAQALGEVVPRFSTLALASVITLVATGLYQSWRLVGGPAQLIGTGYGRLLLLKLGVFGLLLLPAAVNRFVLKPRLRAARTARVGAPAGAAVGGGRSERAVSLTEPGADAQTPESEPAARSFARVVRVEVGLALAVLAVVAVLTGVEPPRGGTADVHAAGFVFDPPLEAPLVRTARADGSVFELASPGTASLVFFGFTHCPDFCPTTLSRWAHIRTLLGETAERTRFVFISVDPERDTPAIADAYARGFDPSFIGVAPDSAEVARIESGFFLRSVRQPPSAPHDGHAPDAGTYDVMHSTRFFLVGPAGDIRVMYAHDAEPEAVAADIRQVLR